jgi:hypothetical protein
LLFHPWSVSRLITATNSATDTNANANPQCCTLCKQEKKIEQEEGVAELFVCN